jgi:hypothetical protein
MDGLEEAFARRTEAHRKLRPKLSREQVEAMLKAFVAESISYRELGRRFGVCTSVMIYHVRKGLRAAATRA